MDATSLKQYKFHVWVLVFFQPNNQNEHIKLEWTHSNQIICTYSTAELTDVSKAKACAV